jgi:hypothetical protein
MSNKEVIHFPQFPKTYKSKLSNHQLDFFSKPNLKRKTDRNKRPREMITVIIGPKSPASLPTNAPRRESTIKRMRPKSTVKDKTTKIRDQLTLPMFI